MIKVTVKLVSCFRHHGSSGAKPTKVRATASSKFNALMNKKAQDSQGNESNQDTGTNKDSGAKEKIAKPYGSHSGNLQVALLQEFDVTEDNKESVMNYIANLTSNFESRSSWDLRAAKHGYKVFKDQVVDHYSSTYGTELSDKTTTEMLQQLASRAFHYTTHQIVITIESDKEIEGGRRGNEDHYFITIKSKMVYSEGKQLLSAAEIRVLRDAPQDKVVLRVSSITRVPITFIWDARNQKYNIAFKGYGAYKARDSYT